MDRPISSAPIIRLPPLTNPAGVPVGAVYGYTTMLWKLADDLNKADGPTHLAVILDKAGRVVPQRHLRSIQGQPPARARRSECRSSR
jgi:5'-3' exonuclease